MLAHDVGLDAPGAEGTSPLLRLSGVSKAFGATVALRDVDVSLDEGEILALVGENGAGKSTLVKIVAGVIPAGSYEGTVYLRDREAKWHSVAAAEAHGVVLIPQELQVAPSLSVAENLLVGHLPTRWGLIDRKRKWATAAYWLQFFGLEASPDTPLRNLAASEQRLVVIAGALARKAAVLVLDEPTVALTSAERRRLFQHLQRLRETGIGILYITHALDELEEIAGRVVVLRNGKVVARLPIGPETSRAQIVQAMLGRELGEVKRQHRSADADVGDGPVLSIHSLTVFDQHVPGKKVVDGVSLSVHRGEIVGLFALVGGGTSEIGAAVCGSWPGRTAGSIEIGEWRGLNRSPREALRRGICMLTDDRQATGVFQHISVTANISASSIGKVAKGLVILRTREHHRNAELAARLRVMTPDLNTSIDALSGGNQQKALLARMFAAAPKVLILDEPTLGVDIGARVEIYRAMHDLSTEGAALLVFSSDVEEISSQCDRIIVIRNGRIAAERAGGADPHELVQLAAGDQASTTN